MADKKDIIEIIDGSTVQHGKLSNRIYVMNFCSSDIPGFIEKIEKLALISGYSKIFIKLPSSLSTLFILEGYHEEAAVPNFFPNDTCSFIVKYIDIERAVDKDPQQIRSVLLRARSIFPRRTYSRAAAISIIRKLQSDDANNIVELYQKVFKTYPFPIHDVNYIKETMSESVEYFGAYDGDRLAAVCSAEISREHRNAEMTDFATLLEYRGNGLASALLAIAEEDMKKRGLRLLYTIARAHSYGMNITFAGAGYSYGGTLINNTNISGGIESMNVWYKVIGK